jgi:BirA family biotin operon repressor/biotin-[acetyl-CoA-carboxylase] ligase
LRKNSGSEKLLKLLEGARGSFVSGEEIARALGVSRAALWKRVNSLRGKGFKIESRRGMGYRLASAPEFSAEEIKSTARGRLGKEMVFLENATSTNDVAMGLAAEGAAHGTVVVADRQSRGRGRLGRHWVSPAGENIYMSVVLRPALHPRDATLLTLLSSVACAQAVKETTGLEAEIKWPNDVQVGGKKLGGILLETRTEPDRVTHAVVGIGINVNMRAGDFPASIKKTATSVLRETGKKFRRTPIASAIINQMDQELKRLEKEGRGPLLARWKELSSTLGRKVKVTGGDGTLSGTAMGIDDEGRLLLRLANRRLKKISSGDIVMVR